MSTFRRLFDTLRTVYGRIFRRQEDAYLRDVVDFLRKVPLFQHFSRGMLRQLAEVLHPRTYPRGEFLYYENDPGLGLYLIQSGRVRLLTEDDQGQMHELRQLGEYELVGEISILGDFRRMETAQAMTDIEVLGFFSPDVKIMAKRNPKIHAALTAALARYLAERQVEMVQLLSERSDKITALRLRDHAAQRQHESETPLLG